MKEFFGDLFKAILLTVSLGAGFQACSSIPTPDGINAKLAAGYEANAAVRATAAQLVASKTITVADGENILAQTDNARAGLDIARTLARTDVRAADDKLTAVKLVIQGISDYLNKRKASQ